MLINSVIEVSKVQTTFMFIQVWRITRTLVGTIMLQNDQTLVHRWSWSSPDLQSTLSTENLANRNLAMDFRWPFPIATRITTILTEYLYGFPQLQAYVRLEPWHGAWPLFLICFPLHHSFITLTNNCGIVRATDDVTKYAINKLVNLYM